MNLLYTTVPDLWCVQITRVPVSEEVRRRHEQELLARRRAHLEAIRCDIARTKMEHI